MLNGTPVQTLAYDATGQLLGDGTAARTYDLGGNRTDGAFATGTGNQTTSDGAWTYTYDANGARTKKSLGAAATTWTFEYDHHGHLTRVEERATDGGTLVGRVDYAYDALGNRVRRVEYTGALAVVSDQRFAFDGWKTGRGGSVGQENFDAWADLDGSNALVARRVFGDAVDSVAARIAAGGTEHWYLTDRQGSVTGLASAAGTPVATVAYSGYGSVTADSNAAVGDRYRYTGREFDALAGGVLHLRDRWLALDTGAFLSRDRKGFSAGDPNLTRYVRNRFPNATDPSGFRAAPIELGSGGTSGSSIGGTVSVSVPPIPAGGFVSSVGGASGSVSGSSWSVTRWFEEMWDELKAWRELAREAGQVGQRLVYMTLNEPNKMRKLYVPFKVGMEVGLQWFVDDVKNNPAGLLFNWVFGKVGNPPPLSNAGEFVSAVADQFGLSAEKVEERILSSPVVQAAAGGGAIGGALALFEKVSEDPVQFLTDVGYTAERMFGEFRAQVVEMAKSAVVTAVATRAAGMIFPLAPIAMAGLELLRNAADISRAARGMVSEMVHTVSDVLDHSDTGNARATGERMANGTYRVATRGAGLALDLTTIVLGVRYLKTQTKHAADAVGQRVNATIDGFLRGFQFTPPVLAGKPRPNILGSEIEFTFKNGNHTATHHAWFEGTRDGKVTLHVASSGAVIDAAQTRGLSDKVVDAFHKLADRLSQQTPRNGGDTKQRRAKRLTYEVRAALKEFKRQVEGDANAPVDGRIAANRVLGLRVRLEKHDDISYVVQQSQRRKLGLNATLWDYLNLDYTRFTAGEWTRYLMGKDGKVHTDKDPVDMRGMTSSKAFREASRAGNASSQDDMHVHHIVMRNGPAATSIADPNGQAKKDVKASKAILRRTILNGGDPDRSWQNLIWAPNHGRGNHSPGYAAAVRYALQKAEETETVFEALEKIGGEFNRGVSFETGVWVQTTDWRNKKDEKK